VEVLAVAAATSRAAPARNDWLDLCRAAAITMVVVSHGAYYLWPIVDSAKKLDILGILGVELFFVLSGFLVGRIMVHEFGRSDRATGWIGNFWMRRWLRTLPNYFLFLAINYLLLEIAVRPAEPPFLPPYFLFLQNLAWPHPQFFNEAWSLSIEEVFYFTMPLFLTSALLLGASRRVAPIVVTIAVLVASMAARIVVVLATDPHWGEGVRKVVALRLDSIMLGVLLSMAYDRPTAWRHVRRWSPALALLLLPCLAMAWKGYDYLSHSFFARTAMLPMMSLGFAGVIAMGLEVRLRGLIGAASHQIALWSYAGYLVNLPAYEVVNTLLGPSPTASGWVLRWAVYMALTVAVSALVYHQFEARFLAYRDRRYARGAGANVDAAQLANP
jgi:peptidoglycan/LPS O-acetylase OafA/YrhL